MAILLVMHPPPPRGGRTATGPATALEPGMQLVYESGGQVQAPWTVDSVRLDLPLRKNSRCAVVHLRRRPEQSPPEESRLCLANDTLYRWDVQRGDWRVMRPVGPGMTWTSRSSSGGTVRYETGKMGDETISGHSISVVPTTVTTSDSGGLPLRRLRERYALSLITATGGVFEVPDSAATGKWRSERSFELRELRTSAR